MKHRIIIVILAMCAVASSSVCYAAKKDNSKHSTTIENSKNGVSTKSTSEKSKDFSKLSKKELIKLQNDTDSSRNVADSLRKLLQVKCDSLEYKMDSLRKDSERKDSLLVAERKGWIIKEQELGGYQKEYSELESVFLSLCNRQLYYKFNAKRVQVAIKHLQDKIITPMSKVEGINEDGHPYHRTYELAKGVLLMLEHYSSYNNDLLQILKEAQEDIDRRNDIGESIKAYKRKYSDKIQKSAYMKRNSGFAIFYLDDIIEETNKELDGHYSDGYPCDFHKIIEKLEPENE